MDKTKVDLEIAYRLLNPGCVVLVSVGDGERDNLFSVAWNMPVRRDPPMVAILSGKAHFSYPLIEKTGEFGLNVPTADLADAVLGCGTTSGSDVDDKFGRFRLTREGARLIKPPLVAEAVAGLECRVCQVVDLGPSVLLLAQVVAATASPVHFVEGRWTFESGLKLLHHLTGQHFCLSERTVTARRTSFP